MVNPNGSEAYDLSLFEPREPKLVALKPNKKAVKEARRRARIQSFLNTALTLRRRWWPWSGCSFPAVSV